MLRAGQTTTYVYDAFGDLAAEYGPSEASNCGTDTCYLTVDHLGSTRLLTDANGSTNVRRYDYQPFGQEILAGTNGRTTTMGYQSSADSSNPKFTGQYRDPESSLDAFPARYLSYFQGRFQSVDPGNAGADLTNPQTWNGYAYVGNNPLSYTDPSGMFGEATAIGAATGNPIGIVIGGLIDLGGLLAGLLEGGGPSFDPWADRDWEPGTPWELGPAQTVAGISIGGDTNATTSSIASIVVPPGLPGALGAGGSNGPGSEEPPFPLGSGTSVPYANGFVPAAAGVGALGGTLCLGSGVCEIAATVALAGTAIYGSYEIGAWIGHGVVALEGAIQRGRQGNVADTEVVAEMNELIRQARLAGKTLDPCEALRQMARANKGNPQMLRRIRATEKSYGCSGGPR